MHTPTGANSSQTRPTRRQWCFDSRPPREGAGGEATGCNPARSCAWKKQHGDRHARATSLFVPCFPATWHMRHAGTEARQTQLCRLFRVLIRARSRRRPFCCLRCAPDRTPSTPFRCLGRHSQHHTMDRPSTSAAVCPLYAQEPLLPYP